MMIYPSVNNLMEKVDSKYSLVCVVSKRARQLVDGVPKLTDVQSTKPVTVAVWEVDEGKVGYVRRTDAERKALAEAAAAEAAAQALAAAEVESTDESLLEEELSEEEEILDIDEELIEDEQDVEE